MLIKDGLAENEWEGWNNRTNLLGSRIELMGDDIFCTNRANLERGISKGVANSIPIKLNQIGTVTETLETIEMTYRKGYNSFVTHRRGETIGSIITDLTVAVNAGHLNTCSGERIEKFNQLMRIDRELWNAARFDGK